MFRRILLALPIAAVAVALTASPSSAQTKSVKDKKDRAPASADITRAVIRNGDARLVVVVKVKNLARGSDSNIRINQPGQGYFEARAGNVFPRGQLSYTADSGQSRNVSCPGLTARRYTGKASKLRVSIPQRCFEGKADTARVTIRVYEANGMFSDTLRQVRVRRS